MSLADEVLALRTSVGMSLADHIRYVRFRGDDAYDALDRVFPRELYVRDGQLSHGLLVGEDGAVFADCYLASDDEEFFLLVEGPEAGELLDYLERHCGDFDDLEIQDETDDHAIVALDGPFAWELMAGLVGQEVVGLPYLTLFHFDHLLCYRAGKTGEYGYGIITRKGDADGLWSRLSGLGEALDVREVGSDALDRCALENWFFNIRAEGRFGLNPIELQLQWRISYRKPYVGSAALARARARGAERRLTALVSPEPVAAGDEVRYGDAPVGLLVNAGYSPTRDDHVALGLLDIAYAHPTIMDFRVSGAQARSVSPPVLNNRSLYVNPQIHTYASRHEYDFPPIEGR